MTTNKINYQLELDKILREITNAAEVPTLLLHSCCGPCSSYVLEYLTEYFKVKLLFYNPNIMPEDEYEHRLSEQKRLLMEMPFKNEVELIECDYNSDEFLKIAKGLHNEPEGGSRCYRCYIMRLRKAAEYSLKLDCDFFTTTLSVSPYKNAQSLNEIGIALSYEYNAKYLPADFKKRNGYKRSIELSKQYSLYRQEYCGCIFSKNAENI